MNTPGKIKRAAGFFVALLYGATNVVFATSYEANLWKERKASLQLAALPAVSPQLIPTAFVPSSVVSTFKIKKKSPYESNPRLVSVLEALPQNLGTVRKILNPAGSKNQIIIHVQDIHQNKEAQENIEKTVQELINQKQISLLALEGAFGPIDIQNFRNFPDQESVRDVVAYYKENNRITGPLVAAFTSPVEIPSLVGVDHKTHYDANVDAYLKSRPIKDNVLKKLLEDERLLKEEKANSFNSALKAFDLSVSAYHEGTISMGDFATLLAKNAEDAPIQMEIFLEALHLEHSLDFDRVEKEREVLLSQLTKNLTRDALSDLMSHSVGYRLGRIGHSDFYSYLKDLCTQEGVALSKYPSMNSYVHYLVLSGAIDGELLSRELLDLERTVYASLANTEKEKELVAASRRLSLTKKLVDFALSPEEWSEYKTIGHRGRTIDHRLLVPFENFYREAEIRDRVMASNLLQSIKQVNARTSVLVTGGFHSPGIGKILAKKEITVVTFTPKVTKVDVGGESKYLSFFAQGKTPLEKLFEGTKLFITPPVMPGAAENATTVAAQSAFRSGGPQETAFQSALTRLMPGLFALVGSVKKSANALIVEWGSVTTFFGFASNQKIQNVDSRSTRTLNTSRVVVIALSSLIVWGAMVYGVAHLPELKWPSRHSVVSLVALMGFVFLGSGMAMSNQGNFLKNEGGEVFRSLADKLKARFNGNGVPKEFHGRREFMGRMLPIIQTWFDEYKPQIDDTAARLNAPKTTLYSDPDRRFRIVLRTFHGKTEIVDDTRKIGFMIPLRFGMYEEIYTKGYEDADEVELISQGSRPFHKEKVVSLEDGRRLVHRIVNDGQIIEIVFSEPDFQDEFVPAASGASRYVRTSVRSNAMSAQSATDVLSDDDFDPNVIKIEIDQEIATVTLNRPDKLNAINLDVKRALFKAIKDLEKNDQVKAIVLTGAGKAFVAGGDLAALEKIQKEGTSPVDLVIPTQALFRAIEKCSKPVVAAINGLAYGGGNELAIAAHYRIAVDSAKFAQTEIRLGIIPGAGGTQRLVRLIGPKNTLLMNLSGADVTSTQAMEMGLIDEISSSDTLLSRAVEVAKALANGTVRIPQRAGPLDLENWAGQLPDFLADQDVRSLIELNRSEPINRTEAAQAIIDSITKGASTRWDEKGEDGEASFYAKAAITAPALSSVRGFLKKTFTPKPIGALPKMLPPTFLFSGNLDWGQPVITMEDGSEVRKVESPDELPESVRPFWKNHDGLFVIVNQNLGYAAFVGAHRFLPFEGTLRLIGGTRMIAFRSPEDAAQNALFLSQDMSRKVAMAGLLYNKEKQGGVGGGKVAIYYDPRSPRKSEILESVARVHKKLELIFTGQDMNISSADAIIMAKVAPNNIIGPKEGRGGIPPTPPTAEGVYMGLEAGLRYAFPDSATFDRKRVSVQGAGGVGGFLIRYLLERTNTIVTVSDKFEKAINDLRSDPALHGHIQSGRLILLEAKDFESIYDVPADIFSPCATQWTVNEDTIPRLIKAGVKYIAGSANDQIRRPQVNDRADLIENLAGQLHEAGILIAPDYVINAGGLMGVASQLFNYDVNEKLKLIPQNLTQIFDEARKQNRSPIIIADHHADQLIDAVSGPERFNGVKEAWNSPDKTIYAPIPERAIRGFQTSLRTFERYLIQARRKGNLSEEAEIIFENEIALRQAVLTGLNTRRSTPIHILISEVLKFQPRATVLECSPLLQVWAEMKNRKGEPVSNANRFDDHKLDEVLSDPMARNAWKQILVRPASTTEPDRYVTENRILKDLLVEVGSSIPTVLDRGASTGWTTYELAQSLGARGIAVDRQSSAVSYVTPLMLANNQTQHPSFSATAIEFRKADISEIFFDDLVGKVDVIRDAKVLHFLTPANFLKVVGDAFKYASGAKRGMLYHTTRGSSTRLPLFSQYIFHISGPNPIDWDLRHVGVLDQSGGKDRSFILSAQKIYEGETALAKAVIEIRTQLLALARGMAPADSGLDSYGRVQEYIRKKIISQLLPYDSWDRSGDSDVMRQIVDDIMLISPWTYDEEYTGNYFDDRNVHVPYELAWEFTGNRRDLFQILQKLTDILNPKEFDAINDPPEQRYPAPEHGVAWAFGSGLNAVEALARLVDPSRTDLLERLQGRYQGVPKLFGPRSDDFNSVLSEVFNLAGEFFQNHPVPLWALFTFIIHSYPGLIFNSTHPQPATDTAFRVFSRVVGSLSHENPQGFPYFRQFANSSTRVKWFPWLPSLPIHDPEFSMAPSGTNTVTNEPLPEDFFGRTTLVARFADGEPVDWSIWNDWNLTQDDLVALSGPELIFHKNDKKLQAVRNSVTGFYEILHRDDSPNSHSGKHYIRDAFMEQFLVLPTTMIVLLKAFFFPGFGFFPGQITLPYMALIFAVDILMFWPAREWFLSWHKKDAYSAAWRVKDALGHTYPIESYRADLKKGFGRYYTNTALGYVIFLALSMMIVPYSAEFDLAQNMAVAYGFAFVINALIHALENSRFFRQGDPRSDVARTGDAIISAAAAVATHESEGKVTNDLIGDVAHQYLGELYKAGGYQDQNPVDPSEVAGYIEKKLRGQVEGKRIDFQTAQRLVQQISQWIGTPVDLNERRQIVVFARLKDFENLKKILHLPDTYGIEVVVDEKEAAVMRSRIDDVSHRPIQITTLGNLFSAENEFTRNRFESHLSSLLRRGPGGKWLLIYSKDLVYRLDNFHPMLDGQLANFDFIALEEFVSDVLGKIKVVPLNILIKISQLLSQNA